MRRSSFATPYLLAAAGALASVACAPDDDVFGNASSAGGGAGVSTGSGGEPTSTSTSTSTSTAQGSSGGGDGGGGQGASGQGGDTTSGPGGGDSGGGGSGPECGDAGDCDDPDGECIIAACVQGTCGEAFVPAGTPTIGQDAGDCRATVCDGNGGTESTADDDDLVDDGNECTLESCDGGELVIDFADEGTGCGGGNLFCNDSGECTGCNNPSQCPGDDDECQDRTCDDGVCGFNYQSEGTPVDDDAGNCVALACDGEGRIATVIDDGDVPVDGNECTRDVCSDGGEPDNPPRDPGAACSTGVCDGDGACVECVADGDCGTDTDCAIFACAIDGSCDVLYADPGDFAGDPVPDDCLHDECGSQGAIVEDVPDDAGDSCGGGNVCDGAGNCAECGDDADCNGGFCRCGACVDDAWIFFSQYVEGSSSNKALEIYNATGEAFDLDAFGCEILRYQNGDTIPVALALTGSIPPDATWVVCNTAASFPLSCDQLSLTAMDFNGDDAVALACGGEIYDVIGQIGLDPGAQWGTGVTSTADNTLYRMPRIFVGNGGGFDPFVPADEWDGAVADTIVGLGEHDLCGG